MKSHLLPPVSAWPAWRRAWTILGAFLLFGSAALAGPHQVWATTIAGTGGVEDAPTPRVLAIDSSGNSYVVGYIDQYGLVSGDAFLAKISPFGAVLWSTTMTGVGASHFDQFSDAVLDASGDLIVTGWLEGASGFYEWVTAKYDPAGNLSATWPDVGYGVGIRRYASATDDHLGHHLILDPSGDVVVSGNNSNQFLLIRYTSTGALSAAWPNLGFGQGVRAFAPPGGGTGFYTFVQRDGLGNYYLGGSGTMGSTGLDFVVVKYNSAGTQQWFADYSFNNTNNTLDILSAMTVDASGKVFLTGQSENANAKLQMATVKINLAGDVGWVNRSTGSDGAGLGVKVDAAGNIYVAGRDAEPGMTVWKYNSAGNPSGSWPAVGGQPKGIRRFGTNITDGATDLWLTGSELYVAGSNFTFGRKLTVWKVNPADGSTVWSEQFGVSGEDCEAYAVKVGPAGHIIATGTRRTTSPSFGSKDIQIIRYSP